MFALYVGHWVMHHRVAQLTHGGEGESWGKKTFFCWKFSLFLLHLAWRPCGLGGPGCHPPPACSPCGSTRPVSSPGILFTSFGGFFWTLLLAFLMILGTHSLALLVILWNRNSLASFLLLAYFGTRFSPASRLLLLILFLFASRLWSNSIVLINDHIKRGLHTMHSF